MKISVVTPSYNQGLFIKKCIESVRRESNSAHVEHIVLDNCSMDNTVHELQVYQRTPGRVDLKVFVEKDGGQTAAINKGFSLACGDIVCWLNTDEWFHEGSLKHVETFFLNNPEIDVVFGDCDFVDSNGVLVKEKREYLFSWSMLIYYGCFLPSCATFVRRRVIEGGTVLDSEFKVTMDFDWYVRLAKAGYRFAHLPISLASFTWHESNISSIFVEQRLLERRMVQDRYSGVGGPAWLRYFFYGVMRYFWLIVRVIRRRLA